MAVVLANPNHNPKALASDELSQTISHPKYKPFLPLWMWILSFRSLPWLDATFWLSSQSPDIHWCLGPLLRYTFDVIPSLDGLPHLNTMSSRGGPKKQFWIQLEKSSWRRLLRNPRDILDSTRARNLRLPIKARKHSSLCDPRLGRCQGFLEPVERYYSWEDAEQKLTTSTVISWLHDAQPQSFTAVFPSKSAGVVGLLGTIVVQGSYWSNDHLDD